MIRFLLLSLAVVSVAACTDRPEPPRVENSKYVTVTVLAKLTSGREWIRLHDEEAGTVCYYIRGGYDGMSCLPDTQMKTSPEE